MNNYDKQADDLSSRLKTRIEVNNANAPVYIGKAYPGTAEGVAKWRIQKLTYSNGGILLSTDFAEGSSQFEYSWTGRAGYNYS